MANGLPDLMFAQPVTAMQQGQAAGNALAAQRNQLVQMAAQQKTQNALANSLPLALTGNAGDAMAAQQGVAATGDPRALAQVQSVIQGFDEQRKAKLAATNEAVARVLLPIGKLPPEQQQAIYAQQKANLAAQNYDVSGLPDDAATGLPFAAQHVMTVDQILQQSGYGSPEKGTVVGPGAVLTGAGGKILYANPAAPRADPIVNIGDGNGGFVQMRNTANGPVPLNVGGGQSANPVAGFAAQATQMVKDGIPQDVAEAWLQRKTASLPDTQVSAGPASSGQLGYIPAKTAAGDGRVPSGYRMTSDGSLEAIPGGPADHSGAQNQGLSADAITNASWRQILTGDSGVKGYGKEATAQRAQIQNQVAQIAKDANVSPQELTTTAGRNKAMQTSLTKLQSQSDMMQKSELAFQNNMDVALGLSAKLDRTGSPVLNKWLLGGRAAIGDPDVAALDAAITTASTDYARIMSGQTGAGGTPISTAEEAKALLRKELSDKSLNAVADVLHKDVMGQQAAVDSQRNTIMQGMQAFGRPAAAPATPTPSAGGWSVKRID